MRNVVDDVIDGARIFFDVRFFWGFFWGGGFLGFFLGSFFFLLTALPRFAEPVNNVTVVAGRDAFLHCAVDNLHKFKVKR